MCIKYKRQKNLVTINIAIFNQTEFLVWPLISVFQKKSMCAIFNTIIHLFNRALAEDIYKQLFYAENIY